MSASARLLDIAAFSAVIVGLLAVGCAAESDGVEKKPDGDKEPDDAEALATLYSAIESRHWRLPDRSLVAIPFDLRVGPKIRPMLPARYEDDDVMARSHVEFLDREKDERLRTIARLALCTAPGAARIVADRSLWKPLGLQGQRELAALLGATKHVDVPGLVAGHSRDPVVLCAAMIQTGHTYGAPPKYLLEEGATVPASVADHWKHWVEAEWPSYRKLSREERGRAELRRIRALWQTAPGRTAAWERYSCARANSVTGFATLLTLKPALREAQILHQQRMGLWTKTGTCYGP